AGGHRRVACLAAATRARRGTPADTGGGRARARFRVRGGLGSGWHAGGRVAARLDTRQDDEEFWLRLYAPGPGGLANGQATLDEAWLEYRPAEAPWSLRLGRLDRQSTRLNSSHVKISYAVSWLRKKIGSSAGVRVVA